LVGLLQYIEPSIQFLLAVFFFHESFNASKSISFSFIWIGLILCIIELIFIRKKTEKKLPKLN
jgi:EamA domain-containing membrane protein RarD